MTDNDNVRQRIISSVFNRRNAAGQQETYVGHLKIWEDAEDGVKPRYIILSHANNVSGFIHKSKLNTNGSFSVGKTWNLSELRGIEVINGLNVNLTLSRTYRWRTENQNDLQTFVNGLISTSRTISGGTTLRLVGVQETEVNVPRNEPRNAGREPVANFASSTARSASPLANSDFSTSTSRFQSPPGHSNLNDIPSSLSNSHNPSRAPSPSKPNATPSKPRSRRPSSASRAATPDVPPPTRTLTLPSPVNDRSSTAIAASSSTLGLGGRARGPSNASINPPPSLNGSIYLPTTQRPTTPHVPDTARPSLPTQQLSTSSFSNKPTPLSLVPSYSAMSGQRSHPSSPGAAPPSPVYSPMPQTSLLTVHTANQRQQFAESPAGLVTPRVSPLETAALATSGLPSALVTSLPLRSVDNPQSRNARISFFDPSNQTVLDRLVASDSSDLNGPDGEEETVQATLASVEEMLEGYEWATDDIMGRRGSTGTAEQIEARLLDELMALEKANIHSFIESDDRIGLVLKYLEQSIAELDSMDSYVSSYKIHLNEVAEDISFIQSQNRGLQVQTQNQRALVSELEQLLSTVHVDREVLVTLTQESLDKSKSIQKLEEAAAELYKALQAGRDRDIAATMERLGEYRTYNSQFCKRILDYLTIMFTAQATMLMGDNSGIKKGSGKNRVTIADHDNFEKYLGRYSGLILYLKEMDESIYGKLCAAYFSASSELHSTQMQALLKTYTDALKKSPEEDADHSFAGPMTTLAPKTATGIRRAGTIVRSPLARGDKEKHADGDLRGPEALSYVLDALAPQLRRERNFIADFLQINDAALTFADYMGLENYFRRQAMRSGGLSQATAKLVRGAMDLIFGFLPAALKNWIDSALSADKLVVIGILTSIERFMSRSDDRENAYLFGLLEKNQARLKGVFDRHINDQIKLVEDTKVSSKKRKGVVAFIKYFPIYVSRVESQVIGADALEIRQSVDAAYEKIVQSMFDGLKHMAKLDGEGEDKGQLNYHVILIENMHHFVAEIGQLEIGSVTNFLKRAEGIYDENLNAYVKLVLRRPFLKILDYFEGVERLLKTTAPTEVSNNSSYNKSALKKVVKEYNAKDVRKIVDALFKRVEKHFTEASDLTTQQESGPIAQGTVMVGVWKACEDELVRITELFQKRISQCYANSGVSLEYTVADVESAFRRNKV